jgi:hypothetical protein
MHILIVDSPEMLCYELYISHTMNDAQHNYCGMHETSQYHKSHLTEKGR